MKITLAAVISSQQRRWFFCKRGKRFMAEPKCTRAAPSGDNCERPAGITQSGI